MSNIEIAEIVVNARESTLLSPERERQIEVTVKNLLIEDLFIKVEPVAESTPEIAALGQAVWLSVPGPLTRFELKRAAEQKIPLTVKLPDSAKPGRYPFHVLVSSDRRPAVEFSQTPPIAFELTAKVEKPFPWLWVAVASGVLAVAAIVLALIPSGLALGDECTPENAGKCPASSSCVAGIGRCVADNDANCEKDGDCLSNQCSDQKCSPLIMGSECIPERSACGSKLTCSPPLATSADGSKPKCLSTRGGACETAADCVLGACAAKVCGEEIGAPCANDAACPSNQRCFGDQGQKLCLLKPGEPCNKRFCTVAEHCTDRGLCPPDDGTCKAADDCKSPRTCANGLCQIPNAGACTKHTECVTGFCDGTCKVPVRACPPCVANATCINGACVRLDVLISEIRPTLEMSRVRLFKARPE